MPDLKHGWGKNFPKKQGNWKCWMCGQRLPDTMFHADHTRPTGNGLRCKVCDRIRDFDRRGHNANVKQSYRSHPNFGRLHTSRLAVAWELKYGRKAK